ncbi:globin [Ancylostoma ceylanicum]|uniref:Globin n=3 Tax=Ancylostoma ceylanicum TaxID=53326 RepID=A0A0D6M961_9BILA|nr:globin [Ancylostoma ceylanicum]EYC44435.1 hypothetical protein Y032_0461g1876 [Ancylostoma ceylanicum]
MLFEWLRVTMGCGSKRVDPNQLTDAEIMALKETWEKAKKRDVGQHILRALIEHKPQFRVYFGIPADATDLSEMQQCKQFQVQAHRIQNFLDTAVSTLGFCPIANVLSMAHRIGQIHFYRGVNFGADNWLAFKKVAVEQITKDVGPREYTVLVTEKQASKVVKREESLLEIGQNGFTPATALIGWEKFMGAIVREMKRGFLDEARRNCKEEEEASE